MLAHRRQGVRVEHKADGSPVTAADHDAETILLAAIAEALPNVTVLSEEAETAVGIGKTVNSAGLVAMVDPLDGTREYVAGGDDFTVNVGLARDGRPVFGMILQPTSGRLFATLGDGRAIEADARSLLIPAAWMPAASLVSMALRDIRTREPDLGHLRALASSRHSSPRVTQFLAHWNVSETVRIGSSLKFCLLACGEADLYPRFGPTHVWDTCAGHAILTAAGGAVTRENGEDLTYETLEPPFLNPSFLAWGRRSLAAAMPR